MLKMHYPKLRKFAFQFLCLLICFGKHIAFSHFSGKMSFLISCVFTVTISVFVLYQSRLSSKVLRLENELENQILFLQNQLNSSKALILIQAIVNWCMFLALIWFVTKNAKEVKQTFWKNGSQPSQKKVKNTEMQHKCIQTDNDDKEEITQFANSVICGILKNVIQNDATSENEEKQEQLITSDNAKTIQVTVPVPVAGQPFNSIENTETRLKKIVRKKTKGIQTDKADIDNAGTQTALKGKMKVCFTDTDDFPYLETLNKDKNGKIGCTKPCCLLFLAPFVILEILFAYWNYGAQTNGL